jgi:hypothetical protein
MDLLHFLDFISFLRIICSFDYHGKHISRPTRITGSRCALQTPTKNLDLCFRLHNQPTAGHRKNAEANVKNVRCFKFLLRFKKTEHTIHSILNLNANPAVVTASKLLGT